MSMHDSVFVVKDFWDATSYEVKTSTSLVFSSHVTSYPFCFLFFKGGLGCQFFVSNMFAPSLRPTDCSTEEELHLWDHLCWCASHCPFALCNWAFFRIWDLSVSKLASPVVPNFEEWEFDVEREIHGFDGCSWCSFHFYASECCEFLQCGIQGGTFPPAGRCR